MTFGEQLFAELGKQAVTLGRKLTRTEFVAFTDRLHDAKHKKIKSVNTSKMSEVEFVAWLEEQPELAGIDIRKEIGRCQFHWKAQGVTPSRKRIVNWFKKVDRPIIGNYAGASSAVRAAADKRKDPPHGWREFMKRKILEWIEQNGLAYEPPGKTALNLYDDFYRMPKSWQAEAWKDLSS